MIDKRTEQKIVLRDGRTLGYAEYGTKKGVPVFYFHGFPSSRVDWQLFISDTTLSELNIRIIAADRPGFGLSDFKPGRKMLDWSEDVAELADKLHIDQFAVLGISGGGPYAASCAYGINDRVTKVGIVSGMGPPDSPGMKDGVSWTIPGTPSIMRRIILMLTSMGLSRNPEQFLSRSKETFSELDRQLLDQPALATFFIDGMREAFRKGISGAHHEAVIYTKLWGFNLLDINSEVYLWHGEQDLNVPISVGRFMAEIIPNCNATFFKEEGHLTLPHNHIKDILSKLIA